MGEAVRAIAAQYRLALQRAQVQMGFTSRLAAHRALWDVLHRAEFLRGMLPEDAPQAEKDSLDTLFEYWSEIKHLPEEERIEWSPPSPPQLSERGIQSYLSTPGRINR